MRRVFIAAIVAVVLCAATEASDTTEIMTTDWLQIVAKKERPSEISVTFGRYAMIFNVSASGRKYVSDLRNVMNFHCSEEAGTPSYINYFMPREISVQKILGTDHLPDTKFRYQFWNGRDLWGHMEVQQNQMFLDFDSDNAPIYEEMAAEVPYVLWLTDAFGIQFTTANQPAFVGEWLPGDAKTTYQKFIVDQIQRNPDVTAVSPVESGELFTACEK